MHKNKVESAFKYIFEINRHINCEYLFSLKSSAP